MNLSHLLLPHKKVIHTLRLQLSEANSKIAHLTTALSGQRKITETTKEHIESEQSALHGKILEQFENIKELQSGNQRLAEEKNKLEKQIENYKTRTTQLADFILGNCEGYPHTTEDAIASAFNVISDKMKIIKEWKNVISALKEKLSKYEIDGFPISTSITNPVTDATDENHTIKELKRRNGTQADTILKLQLELSEYKSKVRR